MAMNRKMTIAEKEVRDYAQRQIERAEQRENVKFTEEQKRQVLEYAVMTGDEYPVRKMVRDLTEVVHSSDEEKVDDILWDARKEIDSFPDHSIGMAELKGYGYTADDMFPLRQEMALELHRVGEKVYCLQPGGFRGDYASREMILEHEGIYGIEKEAWRWMQEQRDDLDQEAYGLYQSPMKDLDRNEALKMFDAGETVYLITTYPRPVAVRERMEIERGPEYYQMKTEDLERIEDLEKRMQAFPQIQSLKEAKLLLWKENRYGIYQIVDGSPGRAYQFMNLNFIESQGYQVKKEDYELIYSAEMLYDDTLDSLYEKFNIAHPADYTGHSLSVSDIVVLNEDGNVKAYFVDSISFRELPDFLHLEPQPDQTLTGQVKTGEEYKPLAKVEELEEANYNMIDNVLNNMPPKKEPYLEYYAAECDEFHSLGKLYKSTNMDEILAKYREIIDDPSLSYYGNGMGIIYCDPNDALYDETEVSLVRVKSIRGDSLDDAAFLAELPMIHEALETGGR